MKNILIIPVIIFCAACSNLERMDTSKILGQMEDYKVKRVSPAQIAYQVEEMGSEIAKALTADFEKQMKNANQARIEEICQLKNMKLIDSLSQQYHLKVRILGQPDIGSNNQLYAKEREVLEAYADNAAKKINVGDNIQKIGDSLFVYTSQIPYEKGVGKLCFSDDTDFAIWSIVLRKSEVVKSINVVKLRDKNIK